MSGFVSFPQKTGSPSPEHAGAGLSGQNTWLLLSILSELNLRMFGRTYDKSLSETPIHSRIGFHCDSQGSSGTSRILKSPGGEFNFDLTVISSGYRPRICLPLTLPPSIMECPLQPWSLPEEELGVLRNNLASHMTAI